MKIHTAKTPKPQRAPFRRQKEEPLVFKIKITYFKMNGRFYTETEFNFEQKRGASKSCYMPDVADYIRDLRDKGGVGVLPGLSDVSVGWVGYIVLNCDDGYPHLILHHKDPYNIQQDY